jgi:hypothetical protein
MSRDFPSPLRWSAIHALGVALAALLVMTSAGVAGPAALVENVVGDSAPARVMDYLDAGQTIRLGSHETIVLSYLHSCVRETITGGVVTIGVDQSEVQAGKVTRTKLDCTERMFVLTSDRGAHFAGRVLRGPTPPQGSDVLPGRRGGTHVYK